MKKGFTVLEVIVLLVVIGVLVLFSIPVFFTPDKQKQKSTVRANVAMAASAATSGFAIKKGATPEKIANAVAVVLNQKVQNPVLNKTRAFTVNSVSKGTVVLVPDNEGKYIEINGYANDTEKPVITKIIYAPEGYEIKQEKQEENIEVIK